MFFRHERNATEIARDYKIPPDISETIVGYASILNSLFKLTNKESIYMAISTGTVQRMLSFGSASGARVFKMIIGADYWLSRT